MNQAQHEREENARRIPRDRDYTAVEPHETAGTPATSAVDLASAALGGKDGKSEA
jgi:hypothetical protein